MNTDLFDKTLFSKKLYRLKILFIFIVILCLPPTALILLGFFSNTGLEGGDIYILCFTAMLFSFILFSSISSFFLKPVSPSEQKICFYTFSFANTASAIMCGFLAVPMGFISARSFSRGDFPSAFFELIICILPLLIIGINIAAISLATSLTKTFEPELVQLEEEAAPEPEEEIDINQPDYEGLTPLMRAVIARDTELVKEICEHPKTDIDFISPATGTTALWIAAAGGNKEIAELLLWRGADAKTQNREGLSAKSAAKENGFFEVAVLISEHEN